MYNESSLLKLLKSVILKCTTKDQ